MLKKADINKAVQRIVLGDESRASRKFKSYQNEILLLINSNPEMVFDLVWYAGQEILNQVETLKPIMLSIMRLTKAVPTTNQNEVINAVVRLDETAQQVKNYPSGMPVMGPMWGALDKLGESLRKSMQIPKGGVSQDSENIYLRPTMEQAERDVPALLGQFQYEWKRLQGRLGTMLKTIDSFNSKRGTYQDRASLALMDSISKITARMRTWTEQKQYSEIMADAESIISYAEAMRSVLLNNVQGGEATQRCMNCDLRQPPAHRKPKGNTLMMYPVKPFRAPIIKSKPGPFRLPMDGAILRIKIGDPLKLYTVDFSNTPSGGQVPVDIDVRNRPILPLELTEPNIAVKWNMSKHLGKNRIFVCTPQTVESGVPPYPNDAESICIPLTYPEWEEVTFSDHAGEDKVYAGKVSLAKFIDIINAASSVSGVTAFKHPGSNTKFYLLGGVNSGFVEISKSTYLRLDETAFGMLPDTPPGDDLTQPSKTSSLHGYGAGGYSSSATETPPWNIKHSYMWWQNFSSYDGKFHPPSTLIAPGSELDTDNTVKDQIKMKGSIAYCPFLDAAYVLDFIVRDAGLYGKLDTAVITNIKVNQQTWNFEETADKLFGDDSPALVKFTLDDPTLIDWATSITIGLIADTELGRLYITDVDYTAGSQSFTALLYGAYNSNPFKGSGSVKGSIVEEYFTLKPKATDKNGLIKLEGDQAIFDALGITPGTYKPEATNFVIAGRPHGGTKRKVVIQPKQYGMKLGSIVTILDPPLEFTVQSITPPLEPIDIPDIESPDNDYETNIYMEPTTEEEKSPFPFDWFGPFTIDNGHTLTAVAELKKHHFTTAVYGGDDSDDPPVTTPGTSVYTGTFHQGGTTHMAGPGVGIAPPHADLGVVGIGDQVMPPTGPLDPIEIDPRVWGGVTTDLLGPDDFGIIDESLFVTGVLLDGGDYDFTVDIGELSNHIDPTTRQVDIDVDSVLGRFDLGQTLVGAVGEITEPTTENKGILEGIFTGLQAGGYDRALEALRAGNLDAFMGMNENTARSFGAMVTLGAAAGQLIVAQANLSGAQTGLGVQQSVQLNVAGTDVGGEIGGGPQFG